MDFKMAIVLLIIGIINVVIFVWYVVRDLRRAKRTNILLSTGILDNVGIEINNSKLEKTCFTVDAQANNAGPNHCDVVFNSDMHMLNKKVFTRDFISTLEKDSV